MFDDLKDKVDNLPSPSNTNGPAATGNGFQSTTAPASRPLASTPAPVKNPGLEDIFSETESGQKPAALRPVESPFDSARGNEVELKDPKMLKNKLFFLTGLLLGLSVFGALGYWGYNYVFHSVAGLGTVTNESDLVDEDYLADPVTEWIVETDADDLEPPVIDASDPEQPVSESLPDAETQLIDTKDSDQDGLTDREELELGTDAHNKDTDGDGLFDREEVEVYKTDPLNPDTDGDGFLDGAEVEAGYNPNGEGRLFNL